MQVQVKATSDGIGYASKNPYTWEGKDYEADLQNGDEVEILNEGSFEEGQFGPQLYLRIKTRNGEKKASVNQSSINILAGEWGTDTKGWVGKSAKVLTKKGVFAGKKGIACYFVTDNWSLDEYGDLTNSSPEETAARRENIRKELEARGVVKQETPEVDETGIPF